MNVAVNIALIALAARQAQQRELVERLHDEGATAPERARPLPESEAELLESLVEEGVVVESAPGTFHVDPVKYAEWTAPPLDPGSTKKVMAVLFLIVAVALFAGLLAFLAGQW
jgi:hypothetical protein